MVYTDDEWYTIYVFTPSVLSFSCSFLLIINVLRGNYMKYFFHQMSAILAFFDIVQCIGIFLDAPWFDHTCYPGAYFFLIGSLCKVLSITYITAIITHVIFYFESPSKKRKLVYSSIAMVSVIFSTIVLTVTETAEILCYDKDPVTFNYNDVSFRKRRMFFVFYAIPISGLFFLIMFLTIYSIHRLREMIKSGGHKAMIRLLQRLIPLSSVFFTAFTPTAVFFLRGYVTDHENFTNKTIAILGQVISGTLYALCYAYFCYVDFTYVSAATKRILENEEANESYDQRGTMDSEMSIAAMEDLPGGVHAGGKNRNTFEISSKTLSSNSGETQNPLSASS